LVVLIHEAGHALVAFALRRQVAELTVGDDAPVLTVRVGGFRLRLGAITGRGDAAGFVLYDGAAASPRDTLAIAIAGPLASLAGAVVTGVAAAWAWPSAGLSLFLGLATLGGLTCCVANLRVSGDGPASWSDGVWVRAAWRAMRGPTPPARAATRSEPREATSIPPPHQ
jgi:Zn-dependent protease